MIMMMSCNTMWCGVMCADRPGRGATEHVDGPRSATYPAGVQRPGAVPETHAGSCHR